MTETRTEYEVEVNYPLAVSVWSLLSNNHIRRNCRSWGEYERAKQILLLALPNLDPDGYQEAVRTAASYVGV